MVAKYESSETDRNYRYIIKYTNLNEKNLKQFRDDLDEAFGVRGQRQDENIRLKSKRVYLELIQKFGELDPENGLFRTNSSNSKNPRGSNG